MALGKGLRGEVPGLGNMVIGKESRGRTPD